ncbi:uncharacterized protein LOC122957775 [Acropora millepora]|uniref:uncharacterized protein LOC122957775 n=1 Tax=Acropora millepora TaxID=45264 RepID=UPI001CF1D8F0|nr:uncharacterized protein LOC122957775 [Acropora millepora]XP_044174060.1 uncharacterized protein LOC122957775 [Acropora millepora]
MKMKMCAVFLFYILAACFMGHCVSDDVQISPEKANSFTRTKTVSPSNRDIDHECYVEGCKFEEVVEAFHDSPDACDYYFAYTCTTFHVHCKDNKHAQKGGAKQGIARKRKPSK